MVAFYFIAKVTFKKGKALPSFQLENMSGCLYLCSLWTTCAALRSEKDVFLLIFRILTMTLTTRWQLSAALK